ncbi:MAG: PqqD family protein [FCB group bacterium]|nr:PqqD family protein [FCB group bacterium]
MSSLFKSELTLSESGFLFDHATGLTYTLNPTGQFIFRQMQKGVEGPEILTRLQEEFEVDETTARKDLDDFVRQLKEFELID